MSCLDKFFILLLYLVKTVKIINQSYVGGEGNLVYVLLF